MNKTNSRRRILPIILFIILVAWFPYSQYAKVNGTIKSDMYSFLFGTCFAWVSIVPGILILKLKIWEGKGKLTQLLKYPVAILIGLSIGVCFVFTNVLLFIYEGQ